MAEYHPNRNKSNKKTNNIPSGRGGVPAISPSILLTDGSFNSFQHSNLRSTPLSCCAVTLNISPPALQSCALDVVHLICGGRRKRGRVKGSISFLHHFCTPPLFQPYHIPLSILTSSLPFISELSTNTFS